MIIKSQLFSQNALAVLPDFLVSEVVRLVNESQLLIDEINGFRGKILYSPPAKTGEGGSFINPDIIIGTDGLIRLADNSIVHDPNVNFTITEANDIVGTLSHELGHSRDEEVKQHKIDTTSTEGEEDFLFLEVAGEGKAALNNYTAWKQVVNTAQKDGRSDGIGLVLSPGPVLNTIDRIASAAPDQQIAILATEFSKFRASAGASSLSRYLDHYASYWASLPSTNSLVPTGKPLDLKTATSLDFTIVGSDVRLTVIRTEGGSDKDIFVINGGAAKLHPADGTIVGQPVYIKKAEYGTERQDVAWGTTLSPDEVVSTHNSADTATWNLPGDQVLKLSGDVSQANTMPTVTASTKADNGTIQQTVENFGTYILGDGKNKLTVTGDLPKKVTLQDGSTDVTAFTAGKGENTLDVAGEEHGLVVTKQAGGTGAVQWKVAGAPDAGGTSDGSGFKQSGFQHLTTVSQNDILSGINFTADSNTDQSQSSYWTLDANINTVTIGASAGGQMLTDGSSSGPGAFVTRGSGNVVSLTTAGGAAVLDGTNDLVKLSKASSTGDQATTIVFGKGSGHAVLKSDIGVVGPDNPNPDISDAFDSSRAYKGLDNLHIVLDGLSAGDVKFYYKQVGIAHYYGGTGAGYVATVAGYIKIIATGETLVLPDVDLAGFRKGSPDRMQLISQYSTDVYHNLDLSKDYALILPDTFSVIFGDGSVQSGTQAAALFTEREPDEFTDILGVVKYGASRNAPDEYLKAEQNDGGGGGGGTVIASSGASSVTGTSASERIDSSGTASLVVGGGGNDTYVYNQGYGALTVDNTDGANNGNEGTVQFGQGIMAASLTFSTAGNGSADLAVAIPGTAAGSVTVAAALAPDGYGRIKQFAFSDGSTVAFAAIQAALPAGASGTATVAGTTQVVQGSTEQDSFLRAGTGALRLAGMDANGSVVSSLALTQQGGAAFTVDAGATVVGAGSTFLSISGVGHTAFVRSGSGTLTVDQFDAAGVLAASQVLTAQGSPVYIDAITSVAGAGRNYFGLGERTLFLHDGTGLVAWGFDSAGAIDGGRVLQWSGFGAAASVVGSGEDVQGSGPRAVFLYSGGAAGSLSVDLFDAGGTLNQTLVLGTNGRVGGVAIDAGTTVVGGGQDVFGTGGHAAFLRTSAGLSVVEFDGTGSVTGSQALSHQGAAAYVDTATTVVGGGQDFFGNGQRTMFVRGGDGALHAWSFDGNGAINTGMDFTVQGAPVVVDTMTSVVGAGGDFFRTGEHTVYLRDGGGLIAWGFGPTGVIGSGRVLLWQGLENGTTVAGGGADFFGNGGHTAFLRGSDGSLSALDFDTAWRQDIRQAFTVAGGAAVVIDPGTKVTGGAGDYFGTGGHGIYVQDAGGAQHVWEFDGAGVRTGVS